MLEVNVLPTRYGGFGLVEQDGKRFLFSYTLSEFWNCAIGLTLASDENLIKKVREGFLNTKADVILDTRYDRQEDRMYLNGFRLYTLNCLDALAKGDYRGGGNSVNKFREDIDRVKGISIGKLIERAEKVSGVINELIRDRRFVNVIRQYCLGKEEGIKQ